MLTWFIVILFMLSVHTRVCLYESVRKVNKTFIDYTYLFTAIHSHLHSHIITIKKH